MTKTTASKVWESALNSKNHPERRIENIAPLAFPTMQEISDAVAYKESIIAQGGTIKSAACRALDNDKFRIAAILAEMAGIID